MRIVAQHAHAADRFAREILAILERGAMRSRRLMRNSFDRTTTMDDERTTRELMEQLGEDCNRCHAELVACIDAGEVDEDGRVHAEYEFHARQLIRAVFA